MLALTLITVAFALAFGTFQYTVRAWQRGTEVSDRLHRGDFVIERLASALRSAAYFRTIRSDYGFYLEKSGTDMPEDVLSWVTSGTAILPPDAPHARGLYRVRLSIEEGPRGRPALAVRAYSHLLDVEDPVAEFEPFYLSDRICGLECRVWDGELQDWAEEWDTTNSLPGRVELAIYLDPEDTGDPEPVILRRVIDLPLVGVATQQTSRTEVRQR